MFSALSPQFIRGIAQPCECHICQVLIVVGGYDDTYLDSTEVMDYTTLDGSWREVSSMKWREVKTTSFFGFLILIFFQNHLTKENIKN